MVELEVIKILNYSTQQLLVRQVWLIKYLLCRNLKQDWFIRAQSWQSTKINKSTIIEGVIFWIIKLNRSSIEQALDTWISSITCVYYGNVNYF